MVKDEKIEAVEKMVNAPSSSYSTGTVAWQIPVWSGKDIDTGCRIMELLFDAPEDYIIRSFPGSQSRVHPDPVMPATEQRVSTDSTTPAAVHGGGGGSRDKQLMNHLQELNEDCKQRWSLGCLQYQNCGLFLYACIANSVNAIP